MTKMPRDEDGLTYIEARAAALCAQGFSQSEAYRQATGTTRAKPETVHKRASDMFKRAHVRGRVRELLKAAKVQDLLSVGQWGEMVLEGARDAREAENWPAFANLTRQLGQAVGALKDNVNMTIEARQDDATLIDQLAGDDLTKLAALQTILGAPEGFDETRH
ncbi:MAG: hypothetical protein ACE1Y4_10650 [Lysobacterales bacterium]